MKVVFLDIDGVLMTWDQAKTWVRIRKSRFQKFKPEAVENLNRITTKTGAEIVISSSWRSVSRIDNEDLFQHLQKEGVKAKVIGVTPDLNKCVNGIWLAKTRGDEIQKWLEQYHFLHGDQIESFVILDDDSDMSHLKNHLVHIENGMATGLTEQQADKAIEILGV